MKHLLDPVGYLHLHRMHWTESGKHLRLRHQILQRLLVMAGDDLAARRPHQLLQPLCALEPSGVVSCEPALWDAVSPLVQR